MGSITRSPHGFVVDMPAACVQVDNACVLRKGTPKESHVIEVSSLSRDGRSRKLSIYISRAGRLRVFDYDAGQELAPTTKRKK